MRLRRAFRIRALALTLALATGVVGGVALAAAAPTQTAAAATATRASASAVAGNGQHACALVTGGAPQCWTGGATDPTGAATPPSGVTFIDISASWSHSCGIVNDGTPADGGPLRCWGEAYASPVPTGTRFIQVETANFYACARDTDWHVSCWGTSDISTQDLPPTEQFSDFALSESYACGLHDGGLLQCWGHPGAPGDERVSGPNSTGTQRFMDVSVGVDHTCAILEPTGQIHGGELRCWGSASATSGTPAGLFRTVEATDSGSCAIAVPSSTVSCWGWGPTSPTGTFQSLDASFSGICGITTDAYVSCFWSAPVTGPVIPMGSFGSRDVALNAGVAADVALISYVSPAVAWSVAGVPSGMSVVNGRLQGTPTTVGGGVFTVQSVGSVFLVDDRFITSVRPGPAAALEIVVGSSSIEGGQAPLQVYVVDAAGNRRNPVDPSEYTAASDIASDTVASGNVGFAFDADDVQTSPRIHTISVSHTIYAVGQPPQTVLGEAEVSVAPLVTGLQLTLSPATVTVHGAATAHVDGLDAGGAVVVDLTDAATLTSTDTGDAIDADAVTPPTVGSRTIRASYRTLQTTAQLTATPGPLDHLVVTPSRSTADEGEQVPVTVAGFDADGNPLGDYTAQAVITSDIPGDRIAGDTVTFAFDPAAAATADVVHTLTAAVGDATGSAAVTVAPATRDIELRLSAASATVGDTIEITVIALDADGAPLGDVSAQVVVTSDQPEDEVTGHQVRFTHASPHVITARYGGLTASATVEVSPAAEPEPEPGPDGQPVPDAGGQLGATGAEVVGPLALAALLMLLGAAALVARRGRRARG